MSLSIGATSAPTLLIDLFILAFCLISRSVEKNMIYIVCDDRKPRSQSQELINKAKNKFHLKNKNRIEGEKYVKVEN